jgi:hypothetical protein
VAEDKSEGVPRLPPATPWKNHDAPAACEKLNRGKSPAEPDDLLQVVDKLEGVARLPPATPWKNLYAAVLHEKLVRGKSPAEPDDLLVAEAY